jgi:hypothetical protein
MDMIKPLFTATANATGGRNGHSATDSSVPTFRSQKMWVNHRRDPCSGRSRMRLTVHTSASAVPVRAP